MRGRVQDPLRAAPKVLGVSDGEACCDVTWMFVNVNGDARGPARLCGETHLCLHDTGAGPSVIKTSQVPAGRVVRPLRRSLQAANTLPLQVDGVVDLFVEVPVGGKRWRKAWHTFLVAPQLSYGVILGRDLLWGKLYVNVAGMVPEAVRREHLLLEQMMVPIVSEYDGEPEIVSHTVSVVDNACDYVKPLPAPFVNAVCDDGSNVNSDSHNEPEIISHKVSELSEEPVIIAHRMFFMSAVRTSDQAGAGYELRLKPSPVASGLPKAPTASGGMKVTSSHPMCCEVCNKTFKQRHSVQQHMAAVHDNVNVSASGLEVCPVLGDDSVVMFGPNTLECVLRGAHGMAHRSSDSMARWLSRQGMTWSGAAKACRESATHVTSISVSTRLSMRCSTLP